MKNFRNLFLFVLFLFKKHLFFIHGLFSDRKTLQLYVIKSIKIFYYYAWFISHDLKYFAMKI